MLGAFCNKLYDVNVNTTVEIIVPENEPNPPNTINTNNSIDLSCEKVVVPK